MSFETFTKGMQDANEMLNRNFAAVETQLSSKAALGEFKTLQSDYYAGAVITEFSSPRQLPHAGLYHIAAMTAEVNAHLDDAAYSMTDYNVGDFYAQLLTSFGIEHGGCAFGTLIVTSPRLAKKVWVARIWEYEIKEWVLLAHASAPQKFELPLAEGWTKYQQPYYQRNAFGEVTIWGSVKKDSAIERSDVIATLPRGFWPPAPFETPAMKFVDGAPVAVMVFVHGNGQISTSATTSSGGAALSFVITYAGQ